MSREKIHTEQGKVWLSKADKELIDAVAKSKGIPPGVLMRTYIKDGLRRSPNTKVQQSKEVSHA